MIAAAKLGLALLSWDGQEHLAVLSSTVRPQRAEQAPHDVFLPWSQLERDAAVVAGVGEGVQEVNRFLTGIGLSRS
jgi:hypothetical protein